MEDFFQDQELDKRLKELGWRLADDAEYCKLYCEKILGNSGEKEKEGILKRMNDVLKVHDIPKINIFPIDY